MAQERENDIMRQYEELGREIVYCAAREYETAYKFLKKYFGGKENIPEERQEAINAIDAHGEDLLAKGHAIAYYDVKDFFFDGRLGAFSGVDPNAIISHIEALVDSGSSLAKQAAKLAKKAPHRRRD